MGAEPFLVPPAPHAMDTRAAMSPSRSSSRLGGSADGSNGAAAASPPAPLLLLLLLLELLLLLLLLANASASPPAAAAAAVAKASTAASAAASFFACWMAFHARRERLAACSRSSGRLTPTTRQPRPMAPRRVKRRQLAMSAEASSLAVARCRKCTAAAGDSKRRSTWWRVVAEGAAWGRDGYDVRWCVGDAKCEQCRRTRQGLRTCG